MKMMKMTRINMTPKVIVVEPNPRFDLSAAQTFGEITYLTEGVNPFDTHEIVRAVDAGLDRVGFDPTRDVVAIVGYVLTISFALAAIAAKHPKINVILYDARKSAYNKRVLDVSKVGVIA